MALALVAEKLDAIPEGQRAWYIEKDGKFNLDPSKVEIEDTAGLKSALQKERDAVKAESKARKDLETRFKDIDPDEVRKMMEKLGGDEESQLIKAGKIDEVIAKRTEKQRAAQKKELDTAAALVKAANDRTDKFSGRVLDNHIRAAATKAGIHSHAVEDALFRARSMFSLNEDGNPIQLGTDGAPVLGKDGKTPFSPAEWLESMKETAPHWFPANGSGGGASGDRGAKGGANAIKRSVFDEKSPDERTKFLKGGGTIVD